MGGRLFMRLGFLTCGMTLMTTSSLIAGIAAFVNSGKK